MNECYIMDAAQSLIDDFSLFDDWEDKYRYVIDMGKQLEAMKESEKNEASKVEGCMSQVWINARFDESSRHLVFTGDSDAFIVKGLIALLLHCYNNQTPEAVLALDMESLFARLGLQEHISPNRRNGFYAMVNRIKNIAEYYHNK